ncbi:MAG: DegT/DnrJ/EryC1/StrS family aminotransferase [Desulfobacteraceae bacterium]|jgi:dTDP-4-amino-4,6-dideoxygalactose transaminase
MQVPLLDLKVQYKSIKQEIMAEIETLVDSQYFILGPKVTQLEKEIAAYCTSAHAVGVSSGTDALLIALMAADIGPGDKILTTPYTFFATAGSIARIGATPVFVDIDPLTYNISCEHLKYVMDTMSSQQKDALKAILPVHLYGQCADMNPILKIAQKEKLVVIEDAAQAIGAEYKGRKAGSMGDYGCFSFFPSKNLGAFGDGGMVTTNSDHNERALKMLRGHGSAVKYYHQRVGGNFRLDALQAAVVSVKLKYLDKWTEQRQENASKYRQLFKDAELEAFITLPKERESRHIYNQFVIRCAYGRDDLRSYLTKNDIGTEIYYPLAMHQQECFAYLGYHKGDLPEAENAASHSLALPIYPELNEDQLVYVVEKISEFYRNK